MQNVTKLTAKKFVTLTNQVGDRRIRSGFCSPDTDPHYFVSVDPEGNSPKLLTVL
jgi:hypothetical protein